jgi:isopenicillin-N epimerase
MVTEFGRACKSEWLLDETATHLNHGTVGAIPKRVLLAQRKWQDTIETNPAHFMLRRLVPLVGASPEHLRSVATVLGAAGAGADSFGFTRNVTSAINAVLRSIAWREGDECIVFEHTYGAITIGAQHIVESKMGRVVIAAVENPHEQASWERALDSALSKRTRLVILDHITSGTAAVVNVAPLIARCHAHSIDGERVRVLVDGAHAPGAIHVDIAALGCDYYAANLHKWMWVPRSCGFLAVRPELNENVHASVLSWGFGTGLGAELDWEGTYDPTPMLTATEAIAMLNECGMQRVQAYNHAMAMYAYRALSNLAQQVYEANEASMGTMAAVFLPNRFGSTVEDAMRVRDHLWNQHAIEVHTASSRGRVLLRVSGQVYTTEADIDRLVSALQSA